MGFIKVIQIEDQGALRRGKTTEVEQMTIAADLLDQLPQGVAARS